MVFNRLTDLSTRDRLPNRFKSTSDKSICNYVTVYKIFGLATDFLKLVIVIKLYKKGLA